MPARTPTSPNEPTGPTHGARSFLWLPPARREVCGAARINHASCLRADLSHLSRWPVVMRASDRSEGVSAADWAEVSQMSSPFWIASAGRQTDGYESAMGNRQR